MEETALAVEALAKARRHCSVEPLSDQIRGALERGVNWVVEAVEREEWRSPQPIGFYFAKLWYWERLYPLIFTTAALRAACESRFEAS
jgi:squalene-hopene/tetraprenyl-beta-curcumene cyclase